MTRESYNRCLKMHQSKNGRLVSVKTIVGDFKFSKLDKVIFHEGRKCVLEIKYSWSTQSVMIDIEQIVHMTFKGIEVCVS